MCFECYEHLRRSQQTEQDPGKRQRPELPTQSQQPAACSTPPSAAAAAASLGLKMAKLSTPEAASSHRHDLHLAAQVGSWIQGRESDCDTSRLRFLATCAKL